MTADPSQTDPPEQPISPELPPAAQWMAAMAAESPPPPEIDTIATKAEVIPVTPPTSLEDRQLRISTSLRRSKMLLPDMDAEIRETLLSWAEELAWMVVSATEGMDDVAAEEILQPRIRALRRMIQRIGYMIAYPEEFGADSIRYIAKQVGLITGRGVTSQVTDQIVTDVWTQWQHQAGAPLAQLDVMRRYVAYLLATGADEDV